MIDEFLKSKGFSLEPRGNENRAGYCTKSQLDQFAKQLAKYPGIKKIAEIGFNAGHSAELFFQDCKELQFFASFDIGEHLYTPRAVEYFKHKYKERFLFIKGDSVETLPLFHQMNPQMKFDLIYIDGMHHFQWVFADIVNAQKMADSKTVLWIDDYHYEGVAAAVKICETLGVIRIDQVFETDDPEFGKRSWIEARF